MVNCSESRLSCWSPLTEHEANMRWSVDLQIYGFQARMRSVTCDRSTRRPLGRSATSSGSPAGRRWSEGRSCSA
eukprot:scaffold132536_cov66-Phaeocystis_antarctica.AAC.2